ncbi:hypothetical protein GG851_23620 [Bordetella petrii]|nr:hypothetical protein [Bordetella petrii]
MNTAWTLLTGRFGSDVRNPCEADLRYALEQLFDESDSNISRSAYETHPDARLRWAQGAGPLFVLIVTRQRRMTFEQWANQDLEQTIAPAHHCENIRFDDALLFWQMLSAGDIAGLRQIFQQHPARR